MKKYLFLLITLISSQVWGQPFNLGHYQYFNYGSYLFDASNNSIATSLNKTYFQNLLINSKLITTDSNKIYFLDSTSHVLIKSYTLGNNPVDYIKLALVKSDTNSRIFSFVRRTFDTLKLFSFNDTALVDSIKFDSINSPVSIVYIDTAHFLATFANIHNNNGVTKFTFRFVLFGLTGVISDDTVSYTDLNSTFLFPVKAIAMTQDRGRLVVVSSGKTYVFKLNSQHNILSIDNYNFTSEKITLANNNYLFIGDGLKLYRINLSTKKTNSLTLDGNIKSILYTPSANVLIAFYGTADTAMGMLYTPLADSIHNTFFDYLHTNQTTQAGGRLGYTYTTPWFDFYWQKDATEKGKYIFSFRQGIGFEPDTIKWYIDAHFVGITTKGNHELPHIFFRHGSYKITAVGIYHSENDSVIVQHYIKTYYDAYPNIIPQDTIYLCDLPDFYIDLVNYSIGNDSIVWFRNQTRFAQLRNQSLAHITKPGEYWVYIYLPDTVLADTVSIYYLDKEFDNNDIQLYINDMPYDQQNNIYCTNDGNIYFNFVLPHQPTCDHKFLVYWYFGDNRTERSSELYTDHKYYNPGIYTVMVDIRDKTTGASYNFIFPIQVSINPVTKYPKVVTVQKLEPYKLYVGYDYGITKQKVYHNNIFYSLYGQQIWDSATITIPITDSKYYTWSHSNYTFWALLGSPSAEGVEIRLFNYHGDSIRIMSNQDTLFPNTSFFYGRPKIDIPHYPHSNESTYPYFWNDESSLTFWYMTHTTPSATGVFDIFDYFIEEYEMLDWHHYQLYPITLEPTDKMSSLSVDSLGKEWKVKFIVHPKDPNIDHIRVDAVGLNFAKYTTDNHYTYDWDSEIPYRIYQDSIVEITSEFEGKYNIYFLVTDDFGCTYKTSTQIYVLDSLGTLMPNVFTPNDDGFNDRWDLRRAFYKQIYQEQAPVEVKIWDKYGRVVAQFLANDVKEWDGTDKNGNKLPPGTYWYLITVANKQHYKGYVTILY